ncbi:inverse autotransporter beta domain-containing protein, partial [Enterobacter mori]
ANTPGTGLRATLMFGDWGGSKQSDAYEIVAITLKDVTVNGYTFAKDAGFPKTGFAGGKFTLNLSAGSAADFTWSADAPWLSVTDGVVSFTGTGDNSTVTITGAPKRGNNPLITYTFNLQGWYINNGATNLHWVDADAYCSAQPGYALPTVAQLRGGGSRGGLGGLWSEWGRMDNYSGFPSGAAWSSELSSSTYYSQISLINGALQGSDTSRMNAVVCRKGL